jgi:hypothetical protein
MLYTPLYEILLMYEVYIDFEVSFQVTTNSVIERKGGQAQDRQRQFYFTPICSGYRKYKRHA